MARIHVFELEDQSWFPEVLRDAGVAFLRASADWTGQAERIRPVIAAALERSGSDEIVDLCSGAGGPIISIARRLREVGVDVSVTMTDLYPSVAAQAAVATDETLHYEPVPVDATSVPADRRGLRTMFNAFHHFRERSASAILRSAVDSGRAIAVVEVLQRRVLALVGMLFVPLVVLALLPLLRPFRWQWLPLTYLLPIIPLFVWWDGSVSVLRIYDKDELLALTRDADPNGVFDWRVEELSMKPVPVPGIALIGIPKAKSRA